MRRPIRKKLGGYSRQITWAKAKGWKRIFRLEQHFSNFNVHENPPTTMIMSKCRFWSGVRLKVLPF